MKKSNLIIGLLLVMVLLLAVGCSKSVDTEPVVADETSEEDMPEDEIVELDEGDVTEEVEDTVETPDTTEETDESVETVPGEDEVEETVEEIEEVGESDSDEATADTFRVISLKDLNVYPEELEIKVGTTVEWRNVNDEFNHIIGWKNQKGMGVTPEPILPGESWSYTFTEPVELKWFSTARPTIQGTITVTE